MYYEPYRRKKPAPRKRRRSFGAWLMGGLAKLILLLLAALIIGAGVLYALPPALFAVEPEGGAELSPTDGLPASRCNVLLLGVDVLNDSLQRSDTMIIASVGYNALKLTSVLRDTKLEIPGHGSNRLNAAYAYGGPALVMKTLNQSFGLNLMHYAVVDFVSLVKLVDAIGGVDIDITEAEMSQINKNVWDARRIFQPLGYTAEKLTRYGEGTHLTGMQALGYARIRKIDSDFTRAKRQRALLDAMVARVRRNAWNPTLWVDLLRTLPQVIQTNMPPVQLLSLAEKAVLAGDAAQLRLPVEGSYEDNGSTLRVTDFAANNRAFMEFAYGE